MATAPPNGVRQARERRGLSQTTLAERVGLSRQSIFAIEAGRSTPAVDVALRIAAVLDSTVEELFGAPKNDGALVAEGDSATPTGRAAVARIADRWVSFALEGDGVRTAADALATRQAQGATELVPLRTPAELHDNVVITGCAPALGLLADRLNSRPGAGRFFWLARSSTAALHALAAQRTHVAGVHLVDPRTGEANVSDVRRLAGEEPVVLITLARWEEGLVVRHDDAGRIRRPADLARRGLRLVAREAGSGAQRLLDRTVRQQGLPAERARRPHLVAGGHLDVARAVAMGAADTGVATRDAALAFGLDLVVLAEERYDLAIPRALLTDPRIVRMLDVLGSSALRSELSALGYDVRATGERVVELETP